MKRFVFWMLVSAGMGLLKLLFLAYVLETDDFGLYSAYFGVATFSYLILTFGVAEKTIKDYPRRWVSGAREELLADALDCCQKLSGRFFVLGICLLLLNLSKIITIGPRVIFSIVLLGLFAAYLALVGSLYRASGSTRDLQTFTLFRSSSTFLAAVPLGLFFGWQGALIGDIVGNLLGLAFSVLNLRTLFARKALENSALASPVGLESPAETIDRGHFSIYLSNLAYAIQSTLDRYLIVFFSGPSVAASYAVLMLIPQSLQLLGNAIVQYVGPIVIKQVYLTQSANGRNTDIKFNLILLSVVSFFLTLVALLLLRIFGFQETKYQIADAAVVISGFIACSQIYGLLEFHLIARDRESVVMLANIVSSGVFVISFVFVGMEIGTVVGFLVSIGMARWAQVLVLIFWLQRRD